MIELATRDDVTVAVAESLTGGLVAAALTEVPGASAVVRGGVVAYASEVKVDLLSVPAATVATEGVVSDACARAMAEGVRELLGTDLGIATTGVAGPSEQEGKPVGTVFVAVASADGVWSTHLRLAGSRADVRSATVDRAIDFALRVLRREEPPVR